MDKVIPIEIKEKKKPGRKPTGRAYKKYWVSPAEDEAIRKLLKKMREADVPKKEVPGQMAFDFKSGGAK